MLELHGPRLHTRRCRDRLCPPSGYYGDEGRHPSWYEQYREAYADAYERDEGYDEYEQYLEAHYVAPEEHEKYELYRQILDRRQRMGLSARRAVLLGVSRRERRGLNGRDDGLPRCRPSRP